MKGFLTTLITPLRYWQVDANTAEHDYGNDIRAEDVLIPRIGVLYFELHSQSWRFINPSFQCIEHSLFYVTFFFF